MQKPYENFHIFHFQKRIVSAETIRGNTWIFFFLCIVFDMLIKISSKIKKLKYLLSNIVIEVKVKKCYVILELREICLIIITYSCNPPVNPILVCNGTFGQYKSPFHCIPHLFDIRILKIYFNTNLKVT